MNLKVLGYAFIIAALVIAGVFRQMTPFYLTVEFVLILIGSAMTVWEEFGNLKN